MDKSKEQTVKNPRQKANILSVITFKWLLSTYLTGYKRELEIKDLYSPLKEHSSTFLGNKISQLWEQELKNQEKSKGKYTPNLVKVLIKCFGFDIAVFGLFIGILEFLIKISQPNMLANLLKYFKRNNSAEILDLEFRESNDNSRVEQIEAFYWGTGIVLGILLNGFITHTTFQGLMHMGMKIRVACCSLVYRKVLRLPKIGTENETDVGQMVNLLSNDVNRLDHCVYTIHYAWVAPIQTVLISYLLYTEVNLAAVGGILTLLLFLPIQCCYGKLISSMTLKLAYRTDERLKLTNQIIKGIKVIKMYAWEKPFSDLVDKAREREVKVIRNNSMATEICVSFETWVPRICLFVIILTYIIFGNDIDTEKVFMLTGYYNVLRVTLYRYFPLAIKEIAEALVSITRLQKFLLLEETESKLLTSKRDNCNDENDTALSFTNVVAKWNRKSTAEALKTITFDAPSKSLIAVIGQVGSGKTTLLQTILKEIPITQGELKINGKISYAVQEPWLFTSSIKQNILFGQEMNKDRYDKVIKICQLECDFQQLHYGDSTLIGERGVNLSGGQCARVNLARAVYRDADIYLLDDPLSAVDTHVGKSIFEECIKTFLKDKTVILITHQYHFLKYTDKIIIMEDGCMKSVGTYTELLASGLGLFQNETDNIAEDNQMIAKNDINTKLQIERLEENELLETRALGTLLGKTYLQYFGAARSNFLVVSVLFISIISATAGSGADYFITYWVNIEETGRNISHFINDDPLRGRSMYISVYGGITILNICASFAQAYTFFEMCMKISRYLHAMMFNSIVRTTLAFFNANPIGRIINRFSEDIGVIDTRIPSIINDVLLTALDVVAIITIVASLNAYFLIAVVVIAVIAYFLRIFYMRTSRSIKRLEGMTRTPVFNHLNATANGLITIRAFNAQDILISEFDSHQDLHSSAWFIFFSGSKAFELYIDFLCGIFTGAVTYTLIATNEDTMAGNVGLAITQCILLTGILQWGLRQTAQLGSQMTSVERVIEYSNLTKEPNLDKISKNEILDEWPERGLIIFNNVSLTYDRQEKPALENLNFTVEPEKMIGIVGRTGAGKSSLINALFRLADLRGEIYIDNVATSDIALQELRSKISIIPQEPILFAGTLRRNLDPFEEYTDHDLWCALEDVELKTLLDSDLGLEMKVNESGSNFSVGQRQLLCLARAIVRKNKILVLDEATANVDPHTDKLIQKTIRKKFEKHTILIVAHRLNTIIDSHKILVMDAGKIVEFDHPYALLQKTDGFFYSMVQQTGLVTAANLFDIAKTCYEREHKS